MKEGSFYHLMPLVENAAKIRGNVAIPREFIKRALDMIYSGEADVPKYPAGEPSLKGVYDIAVELMQDNV